MKSRSKNKYWYWSVASPREEGKLISFLSQQLGSQFSQRSIKRALEKNHCLVNGHIERFASKKVFRGDEVALAKNWQESESFCKQKPLSILYEDEHLLILDKPAGVCCDAELEKSVREGLQLLLIHRLDRDTTGALMFAKTASAKKKMIELFKGLKVKKSYIALVDRRVLRKEGKIENKLAVKKQIKGQKIYGSSFSASAKPACTIWKRVQNKDDYAVLECQPITGRTHQIRAHLAEMGHPILGDALYCRSFTSKKIFPTYMLHAWKVEFPHPFKQKWVSVEANLPFAYQE